MTAEPVRLGLVGFGYWGRKLYTELQADPRFSVRAIMTRHPEAILQVPSLVPRTSDLDSVASDPRIDAVIVATPVQTHRDVGGQVLAAGKHLFIEKPLAATGAEARELQQIAQANGCEVFVDYTFSVLRGVERVSQLVAAGEIGVVEGAHLSMTQFGRFNGSDAYQLLASHMLAVLDRICPLNRLDLIRQDVLSRRGVVETGIVLFQARSSGEPSLSERLRGIIDVSLNSAQRMRWMALYGSNGSISYHMVDGYPIIITQYGDRRDRSAEPERPHSRADSAFASERGLQSALSAFYGVLRGGRASNLESAVVVSEILDRLAVGPPPLESALVRTSWQAKEDHRRRPR